MLKNLYLIVIAIGACRSLQAQPSFKGGSNAFDEFVTKNIIYPDFSKQNCIAAVIRVSFMVNDQGKVSAAHAEQGPGIDLDDEAVRVVKLTSGKWIIPAGFKGEARVILPVRFTPDYTRCNSTGSVRPDMTAAINNYRIRQEQENAITNYYINKDKGTADPAKEATISALKEQLGINDEFYSDLLEQAKQKLKQGDKDGACEDWKFIRNTGSNLADTYIAKYCQ